MRLTLGLLALASGVLGFGTAGVLLFVTVRSGRSTREKVQEVHLLVNARLERAMMRVEQLADALRSAGVMVPDVEPDELPDVVDPSSAPGA